MKKEIKEKIIEILETEIVIKAMPLQKVKPLGEIADKILELFEKEEKKGYKEGYDNGRKEEMDSHTN